MTESDAIRTRREIALSEDAGHLKTPVENNLLRRYVAAWELLVTRHRLTAKKPRVRVKAITENA